MITGTTAARGSTISPVVVGRQNSIVTSGLPVTAGHAGIVGRRSFVSTEYPVGGGIVTSGNVVSGGQVLTSGIPFSTGQTIVRRSRVDVYPAVAHQTVVAPTPVLASVAVPQTQTVVERHQEVRPAVVVEETVNLPPPPPIERRRNRSVDVYKQRGFCDGCPWWLCLLLGLIGLLLFLGLLYGLKDTLFKNWGSSKVVKTGSEETSNTSTTTTTTGTGSETGTGTGTSTGTSTGASTNTTSTASTK